MLQVAEEVRAPPNGHFRDRQSVWNDGGKPSSSSSSSLFYLPEIITVRMMGEAGNQDGDGVGIGFLAVKSGYLSFS